jgi:hypothetical protein
MQLHIMNSDVFTFKTDMFSLSYAKKHDTNKQVHQHPTHTPLRETSA